MGFRSPRAPTPTPTPAPAAGFWVIADLSLADQRVVRESFGTPFGQELEPTVAWLLDRWAQDALGMRFRLTLLDTEPCRFGRARGILQRCFVSTQHAVQRWAVQSFEGDAEAAVQAAVREHLDQVGLSRGVEEAHG